MLSVWILSAIEHLAVKDEEEIQIDTLLIKMLDTPGHTPECSVYIVSDLERGSEPALAFTGDTLLVGDAGSQICSRISRKNWPQNFIKAFEGWIPR